MTNADEVAEDRGFRTTFFLHEKKLNFFIDGQNRVSFDKPAQSGLQKPAHKPSRSARVENSPEIGDFGEAVVAGL